MRGLKVSSHVAGGGKEETMEGGKSGDMRAQITQLDFVGSHF